MVVPYKSETVVSELYATDWRWKAWPRPAWLQSIGRGPCEAERRASGCSMDRRYRLSPRQESSGPRPTLAATGAG